MAKMSQHDLVSILESKFKGVAVALSAEYEELPRRIVVTLKPTEGVSFPLRGKIIRSLPKLVRDFKADHGISLIRNFESKPAVLGSLLVAVTLSVYLDKNVDTFEYQQSKLKVLEVAYKDGDLNTLDHNAASIYQAGDLGWCGFVFNQVMNAINEQSRPNVLVIAPTELACRWIYDYIDRTPQTSLLAPRGRQAKMDSQIITVTAGVPRLLPNRHDVIIVAGPVGTNGVHELHKYARLFDAQRLILLHDPKMMCLRIYHNTALFTLAKLPLTEVTTHRLPSIELVLAMPTQFATVKAKELGNIWSATPHRQEQLARKALERAGEGYRVLVVVDTMDAAVVDRIRSHMTKEDRQFKRFARFGSQENLEYDVQSQRREQSVIVVARIDDLPELTRAQSGSFSNVIWASAQHGSKVGPFVSMLLNAASENYPRIDLLVDENLVEGRSVARSQLMAFMNKDNQFILEDDASLEIMQRLFRSAKAPLLVDMVPRAHKLNAATELLHEFALEEITQERAVPDHIERAMGLLSKVLEAKVDIALEGHNVIGRCRIQFELSPHPMRVNSGVEAGAILKKLGMRPIQVETTSTQSLQERTPKTFRVDISIETPNSWRSAISKIRGISSQLPLLGGLQRFADYPRKRKSGAAALGISVGDIVAVNRYPKTAIGLVIAVDGRKIQVLFKNRVKSWVRDYDIATIFLNIMRYL